MTVNLNSHWSDLVLVGIGKIITFIAHATHILLFILFRYFTEWFPDAQHLRVLGAGETQNQLQQADLYTQDNGHHTAHEPVELPVREQASGGGQPEPERAIQVQSERSRHYQLEVPARHAGCDWPHLVYTSYGEVVLNGQDDTVRVSRVHRL